MTRFVIIVGEASGDQLARGLIQELSRRLPDACFEGLTGPQMRAVGCHSWGDYEQLSVMGVFEVLRHLPRLWLLRRDLQQRLRTNPPDILIGVDSPDFNLGLEKYARRLGIPAVHYVSPSVWAWRRGRLRTLRAACDLVLCLLPFEARFLEANGVSAAFVGHPMADEIPVPPDKQASRLQLGLAEGLWVALLPGSRLGELEHLGPVFLDTVKYLRNLRPDLNFIAAAASRRTEQKFSAQCRAAGLSDAVQIRTGAVRQIIGAADAVLLSSGTATLETMLLGRPMVVSYKVNALTAALFRGLRLVKIKYFALPNLLAGELLVPELLQEQATGPLLSEAVLHQLEGGAPRDALLQRFAELAGQLRRDASSRAADSVLQLLKSSRRLPEQEQR